MTGPSRGLRSNHLQVETGGRRNAPCVRSTPGARGFTLLEVLVSTAITLMLMAAVAQLFAFVTNSVADSQAFLETSERLRLVKQLLQTDLLGVTAPLTPPLDPAADQGYFEYIEGPIGPIYNIGTLTSNNNDANDETIGDLDDVLMFTTRGVENQFVARYNNGIQTSSLAEVSWFLRGTNLYRRVLLVMPGYEPGDYYNARQFYLYCDMSMRMVNGQGAPDMPMFVGPGLGGQPAYTLGANSYGSQNYQYRRMLIGNSLGDLTKRENRYAHQPLVFPHDARFWGRTTTAVPTGGAAASAIGYAYPGLNLPTLRECSYQYWPFPYYENAAGHTGLTPSATPSKLYPFYTAPAASSPTFLTTFYPNWVYVAPDSNNATTATATSYDPVVQGTDHLQLPQNNYGYFDPWGGISRNGTLRAMVSSGVNTNFVNNLNNIWTLNKYLGTRIDDLVMTNVVSFDVKAWDPGAPIFETVAYVNNQLLNPKTRISVAPGDPGDGSGLGITNGGGMPGAAGTGYARAVRQFIVSPKGIAPASNTGLTGISFGAYVDLNCMWPFDVGIPRAAAPVQNTYEWALQQYEVLLFGSANKSLPRPRFCGPGNPASGLSGLMPSGGSSPLTGNKSNFDASGTLVLNGLPNTPNVIAAVYDTWSTHYESDGIDQPTSWNAALGGWSGDQIVDNMTNGLDDNKTAGIDDATEAEAPPPYPYPMRSIQIKIRCIEPSSRQLREITLVHEFLPE